MGEVTEVVVERHELSIGIGDLAGLLLNLGSGFKRTGHVLGDAAHQFVALLIHHRGLGHEQEMPLIAHALQAEAGADVHAFGHQGLGRGLEIGHVLGMDHAQEIGHAVGRLSGRQPKHAAHLATPHTAVGGGVPLPTAHLGDGLGDLQLAALVDHFQTIEGFFGGIADDHGHLSGNGRLRFGHTVHKLHIALLARNANAQVHRFAELNGSL